MTPYLHDAAVHHLGDPERIVPVLTSMLPFQSVVDFGCGIGTFLSVFRAAGTQDALGLDGNWVDREALQCYLPLANFSVQDLTQPVHLAQIYDLAICLEVAEHLPPSSSEVLVDSLSRASDRIVFSAAIPGQGGQNHLNEQWPNYWQEKFAARGFVAYDIVRPHIWDNPEISWWYRQNVVVYVRRGVAVPGCQPTSSILSQIHPELYQLRQAELEKIASGRMGRRRYLRWFFHSLLRRK